MPLAPGAKLGPYEIQSAIGVGGMGEVYKARDTRLERIVAVKVLPAHVAGDPELKQRFEREAKTLAQQVASSANMVALSVSAAGLVAYRTGSASGRR